MTKPRKIGLTALIVIAAVALDCQGVSGAGRNASDVSTWVANAVQWDAVWGSGVTCTDHAPTLSQQLASSKDHIFSIETVQHADGVVVMVPELNRVVSVRLTTDQQLGSIRVETTCEPDLASRSARLKSLQKSSSVQDERLQKHLEELKKRTVSGIDQESSPVKSTLKIDAPSPRALPSKQLWPRNKVESLKSVETVVHRSFTEACVPGSQGIALIPNFELYDPAVLTVIKSKELTCVLPIGFEYREHSTDPYAAYATHGCVADPTWVKKIERLIRLRSAEEKSLSCNKARNP